MDNIKTLQLEKHGLIGDLDRLVASYFQAGMQLGSMLGNQAGLEMCSLAVAKKHKFPVLKRLNYLQKMHPARSDQAKNKALWSQVGDGYLIQVAAGCRLRRPIQTCLYLTGDQTEQLVQNLIVLEAGAQAEILAGCWTQSCAQEVRHIGVSEIFVDDGAKLNLTMVHDWSMAAEVLPRTLVYLGQGSELIYNYVCLRAPAHLETDPVIELAGANSRLRAESVLLAQSSTQSKLGTTVFLNAQNTQANLRTQVVASGGQVTSGGLLVANTATARGHLECDALLLNNSSQVSASPNLQVNCLGAKLSHEASIGRIDREQIEYLQARGLRATQAQGMIVSGLVSIADNPLLSEQVRRRLQELLSETDLVML